MTIGITTRPTTPIQCTALPEARPAPTSPPTSAWEEEDGSPKYQGMRFQRIGPTRAARMTVRPAGPAGGWMILSATVAATSVESRAPPRLATAARVRAARGVSARVETALAIAFAASWNPLV